MAFKVCQLVGKDNPAANGDDREIATGRQVGQEESGIITGYIYTQANKILDLKLSQF